MKKQVAVVLCGSGFKDGSEIRESVGVLWALSQLPVDVHCYAPDALQADVVNCFTQTPMQGESRNMLVESARIARGQINPLSRLNPAEIHALIIPGGFGAAKNLCTFAKEGAKGTVLPDLLKIITTLHAFKKPIGAVCIAPTILALALPTKHLTLTLGAASETSQEIAKLGHEHIVCAPNDCVVDTKNKITTTPAYMYDDAPLFEIFEGIKKCVAKTLEMA